jgi:hypothetical protein
MVQTQPRSVAAAAVVLAACLAVSGVARAAPSEQETITKVVDLNRAGVEQFQRKHYDAARKLLKQALELCESAGLERHPAAARTHIHLGIVIIAGYGQREIGSRQFNDALQIDPNITLTAGLATPAVQDVFNEALVAVSPHAASPAASAEAPAAAQTPAAAEAPAAAEPVTSEGQSTDSAPAAETTAAPPSASDDAPKAERRAPAPARAKEEDDEDDDGDGTATRQSRVQLGAMLGGGVGWASGMGDLNADTPVSSGFASAKLGHLELEGGYWMTNEIMLSLQGRFQMITGPTVIEANNRTYHPASYAAAVFGAGTWSPAGSGALRPYVSGAVGAGKIRHVVTLSSLKDCGPARNQVCVDTVGAGPLLAGVGGGVTYDLGEKVSLVAGVNTQIGAPTFTFNIDLNAGVAFRL